MFQTMILHWSPRSPYVRKVMIAIAEMGLQDRVRTVRTVAGGTTPHWELMKINPGRQNSDAGAAGRNGDL